VQLKKVQSDTKILDRHRFQLRVSFILVAVAYWSTTCIQA
jgi:hypothetical protein